MNAWSHNKVLEFGRTKSRTVTDTFAVTDWIGCCTRMQSGSLLSVPPAGQPDKDWLKIKSTHHLNWTFMERCHAFAKDTQSKSEPQSQLSKSAYSSVGHTQTNTCVWLSGQQRNVGWWSCVIMDLCGETNYKLLPQIYHLVCPGLASLCSANEFSSNCPIAASSWVNSLHLFHGTRWILVGKPTHHTCSLCAVVIAGWQGLSSNISAREGTALKMSTHSALQHRTGTDRRHCCMPIVCQD